jgi:predicted nucleic acid-binding protein
LLGAIAGRAAARVFRECPDILVVTTRVTFGEVRWHLAEFAERYELDIDKLHEITDNLPMVHYGYREYRSHIEEARRYLEYRDPSDVGLAALALKLDVPVWSNDNDFRELPIPVYTTAALLRALGM